MHKLIMAVVSAIIMMSAAAHAASCKQARNCDEAVEMWCNGYARADGDNDGIPCESVCRSRAQVEAAKKRVGCSM